MSWIASLTESLSSFFNRSSEAQVLKVKIRESKKSDKEFWRMRMQQIFAECEIDELQLMKNLADSNNKPQKTQLILENDSSRELKIKGVKENLYQIIETYESDRLGYPEYDSAKVRISVPVFEYFKKQFDKYGRCRLPAEKKKERSKK